MTATVSTTPGEHQNNASARIASEIRAELARQGVSFRELSRRLGVSQPWVTRRVSVIADVGIKVDEIDVIAEALGTTAERLIARSGWLPRLDSNQQPSGYPRSLARILTGQPIQIPTPPDDDKPLAEVVDLPSRRSRHMSPDLVE